MHVEPLSGFVLLLSDLALVITELDITLPAYSRCTACALQGVLKRHSEGNASAKNAAEVGGQAKNVATLGYKALKDFLEV